MVTKGRRHICIVVPPLAESFARPDGAALDAGGSLCAGIRSVCLSEAECGRGETDYHACLRKAHNDTE